MKKRENVIEWLRLALGLSFVFFLCSIAIFLVFTRGANAQVLIAARPYEVASTTISALGIDTPLMDQVRYEQNRAILKELKQMNIYLANIVSKL